LCYNDFISDAAIGQHFCQACLQRNGVHIQGAQGVYEKYILFCTLGDSHGYKYGIEVQSPRLQQAWKSAPWIKKNDLAVRKVVLFHFCRKCLATSLLQRL